MDADDFEDERADPATCTREWECRTCGVTFTVGGRMEENLGVGGYTREFAPEREDCAACESLGQAPPKCIGMGCGGVLQGNSDDNFTCMECDAEYPVEALRTYAFGLECTRIVAALPERGLLPSWGDLIIRAAASLGIWRKP
jgi:hypothetical protein